MAIPLDVRQIVQERELSKADPVDTTIRTLVTVGLYAALLTVALTTGHVAAWATFWIVGAVLQCGAYAAVHEAIHGSLYQNRWANDLAGVMWGLAVLNPYASYRSWHYQHHVYTRTENDTEPAFDSKSRVQVFGSIGLVMLALNVALWIDMALVVVGRPREYAKRTARPALTRLNLAAFAMFAALLAIGLDSWRQAAALWAIPALGGSILSGLAVSHEHLSCVNETSDVFLHSRTVRSNRVTRFFLWNANYHTGHHLVPTVTGKNLPILQTQIDERCVFSADSFSGFYGEVLRDPRGFDERARALGAAARKAELAESDDLYGERAGRRMLG